MDDIEIRNIWKEYDRKLEEARVLNLQSWALNLHWFETMQHQKVRSKLWWVVLLKITTILSVIMLEWILVKVIGKTTHMGPLQLALPFVTPSIAGIFIIQLWALGVYTWQLVLMLQINNSETIVETQLKLARLRSATIQIVRVLALQTPFFSFFFYPRAMLHDIKFWLIGVPVTLLFTAASVWFYRNFTYKNAGKKWFKVIITNHDWNYITKSMGFIKEIEAFKNNL